MSLSSVGSDKAETVWWQAGLFSVQTGTYSDVLVASVQLEYPEGLHRALIGFERHANQAAVRFSLEVRDRGGTDCVRAHTSNIDSWDYLLDEESDPCAGDVLRVELRLGSDGPCPSAADDGFLVSLIAEDSSGWRVTLEQVEIRVPVGNPQGLLESALHDQGVQLRRTLGAACLQQVQTHNAELRRDSGEELCVGVFEYRDAISESCENAWEGTVLVIGAGPERMCCVLELSNASEEELVSIARKAELPVTIREP